MKKHDKINIYCVFFKTGSILLAMKKEENAVGEKNYENGERDILSCIEDQQ